MTLETILSDIYQLRNETELLGISSREMSLTVTKLDEAGMWIKREMENRTVRAELYGEANNAD